MRLILILEKPLALTGLRCARRDAAQGPGRFFTVTAATTLLAALVFLAAPSAAGVAPTPPPAGSPSAIVSDTMAQRMQACTPCHGAEGRAARDGYYPRIAGKPAGYLYEQLRSFRDGRRNQAAMTHLLAHLSDDYLMAMARHFADQDLPYPPPLAPATGPALLARGERLVKQGDPAARLPSCTSCHGAAMTGRLPGTPGLLGLPRDYLVAQIGAWQARQRRGLEPDCMAWVARQLKPDDVLAVTSWLAAQPLPAASGAVPDDGRELPLDCAPVTRSAETLSADRATSGDASRGAAASDHTSSGEANSDPIARGAYLARAGNCEGCHTARGGPPYGGGRGIQTPFGTVYAGNLTPDPQTGLGGWTPDDFRRALHEGRSRDGRLLYPAFPYPNYSLVTARDADDLFAYLQSLKPVVRANPAHALRFPFDTQMALRAWRALYFEPTTFEPRADRPADWNRGDYLIRGLGHCDACHSPRNLLGAIRGDSALSGGELPGQFWYAPSLTANAEAGVGDWPHEEVVALLRDGVARQGSAIGPMADVVATSTRFLSAADLNAMATRLKALAAGTSGAVGSAGSGSTSGTSGSDSTSSAADDRARRRGAAIYDEHCSACHGRDGAGATGIYPPLAGNRAVTLPIATNLIRIVSEGGFPPSTPGNPEPFGMPPFAHQLPSADIADVITYIRQAWGNRAAAVTPTEVARSRP